MSSELEGKHFTDQNDVVLLPLLQEVVDQLSHDAQGQVLEGQGRAVEQLRDVEATGQLGHFDDILAWFTKFKDENRKDSISRLQQIQLKLK